MSLLILCSHITKLLNIIFIFRNSGITGPCGVNLNRTHVLIVGGRYGIFKLDDQAEGLVGVSVGMKYFVCHAIDSIQFVKIFQVIVDHSLQQVVKLSIVSYILYLFNLSVINKA